MLTEDQVRTFHQTGHLTVADVFHADEIDVALNDLGTWSQEFLSSLPDAQRAWYLEAGSQKPLLRKLDNPVHNREVFRQMAGHRNLIEMVHQLIGPGVSVFFSQVFMK